jgi:ribosomal protein S18 acetylase RimI-like enzyme
MDKTLLDHLTWRALAGPHARYALGTHRARRYAPGFSPILGFEEAAHPHFDDLLPFCERGESFYCEGWGGAAPAGWHVEFESTMFKMAWDAAMPSSDEAPHAVPLAAEHAAQAVALASLTRPGPFGLRTIELGEYFGLFDGERLVAMAGERMCAAGLREISGVCTHPDSQGQGLARRLMLKLIRRELLRGERPVLHVMRDNVAAHGLYQRMGFRDLGETIVRVVSLRS